MMLEMHRPYQRGAGWLAPWHPVRCGTCQSQPFMQRSRHGRDISGRPEERPGARFCKPCASQPRGDSEAAGSSMAADFAAHVLQTGAASPAQRRKPSHLMPPTEVVAAQLDALQRNDWPDSDAGVAVAFAFSKPHGAELLLPGEVSNGAAAAWGGAERWLRLPDFSNQLHSPPYAVLLDCDSWQPTGPMSFPQQREGQRALQAVAVTAQRRAGDPLLDAGAGQGNRRLYSFTFCLERISRGPFKDCWMTIGLRVGDYASV